MSPSFLPVFRAQTRYWQRHRLQALLCLAGIVLGVAVFSAIQLANRGALAAFERGVTDFAGRATHRVYAPDGGGVPEGLFPRLAGAAGVKAAAPFLHDDLRTVGSQRLTLTALGIDPLAEAAFRDYSFLAGAKQGGDTSRLERLLADPDGVLLPRALARDLGLEEGSRLEADTAAGRRAFTVLGVFDPPQGRRNALSRTVVLDVAAHQERFAKLESLDAINLILDEGSESATEASLRALLPPGAALERVGRRLERVESMSRAFRLNLETLGLFALLVALFLIYNAASFSVLQREGTIAMLRCIGAAARTVFTALLAEAALLGAAGAVGGVLLGRWLGGLMLRNTGATLFEVVLNSEPLPAVVNLDAAMWAQGLALGVGVSLVGALRPAWNGAQVSPLAAVQGFRTPFARPYPLWRWTAMGVGALALGGLLAVLPGTSLTAGLIGATALALGGAALCPPALALTGRLLAGPLAMLAGAPGRMAARNLARSLPRTGMAAGSLMVALALALSIEITVRSFKRTFELWLEQAVTADLYLESALLEGAAPLPAGLAARLRALSIVSDVAVLRSRRVVLGEREVEVLALDLPAYARTGRLPVRNATPAEAFSRLAAGEALVSETLAFPLGLHVGDALTLPTPTGPRRFAVGAVVQNYSAPQGLVYLSRERFAEVFGPAPPRRAAVWLEPGTSLEAALRTIEALPEAAGVRLTPLAELRENALRVFDRTFAITDLMGGLAAFVAFIAVVSSLTALLEERMRTLGFLRAVGLSRRGLAVSQALEAGLLALTATLLSWGTGLLMSLMLIFVINLRAFGWTLQFLPGEGSYGRLLALALAAALLGSGYPVWRAVRLSVSATIRDE